MSDCNMRMMKVEGTSLGLKKIKCRMRSKEPFLLAFLLMGANKCNRFRILTTYDMTDQMANKRGEKMEENFTERILLMPLKLL